MIEKLKQLYLPVDELLEEYCKNLGSVVHLCQQCGHSDHIRYLITLSLVQNKEVVKIAYKYITKLLEEKEQYGYLYFLNDQKMFIPLIIEDFKGDVFIDSKDKSKVKEELEKMAAHFVQKNSKMFQITIVELLNFFIRIINPTFTWLAVENMMQCVPWHTHLIVSPDRPFSYKTKCK